MNRIRHIRRLAAVLVSLAVGLVAFATPAFARLVPEPLPGGARAGVAPSAPAPVRIIVAGGMPGWQIVLIAAGAALFAATLAVLADRARTTRRKPATAAA